MDPSRLPLRHFAFAIVAGLVLTGTAFSVAPLTARAAGAPAARPAQLLLRGKMLYIADPGANVIRQLDLRTGLERIVAGKPGSDAFTADGGLATAARLCSPHGMVFDTSGNLYFAETGVNRVRKVAAATGILTTVAGRSTDCGFSTGTLGGDGGLAIAADLATPFGVTFDELGDLFIADTYNHRIRKVTTSTGIITTIAGSGAYASCCNGGFSGDGGPATSAELYQPTDLLFDAAARLVFSDHYNNRIRSIDTSATIITTIAGGTVLPFGHCDHYTNGVQAINAVLCGPHGLSIDGGTGVLYFSDYYANRIRKVSGGKIYTVAGSGPKWPDPGGYSGDGGPAKQAVFNYPEDIAFAPSTGNLYIADTLNGVIRKVNARGIVSTLPEIRV